MKKRLRKKKHLGEFAVLGVSLRVSFVSGFDHAAFDQFIDDFIDWIESKGLLFGGGGSHDSGWNGVIEPGPGRLAIPAEIVAELEKWLEAKEGVADSEISEPWDINYGRNPFDRDLS